MVEDVPSFEVGDAHTVCSDVGDAIAARRDPWHTTPGRDQDPAGELDVFIALNHQLLSVGGPIGVGDTIAHWARCSAERRRARQRAGTDLWVSSFGQ